MKRQLTLSQFVTGPTAAEGEHLGAETRIDSQPKRTKLSRGEVTGRCVNDLGLEPDSGRRDLGRYSDETIRYMNDDDKYKLIEQAFRPGSNYKLPVQVEYGKKRSFQHCWLQSYSWLTYSEAMNGGFCIPCVFFAKGNRSSLGQLVNSPMTSFTRAKKTMEEHKVQECHVVATEDLHTFKRQMQKGELSVEQMIESEALANVKRNRSILKSILKSLVFCGKQNIALRGHRDHGSMDLQGENQGNFRALLQFRVDAGDTILEEHFRTTGKNSQYISPRIQNDLLACIGQWIRDKILEEVREAEYFAVCADEAADVSNREQMPLIVRFVDKQGKIGEEFLEFILCDEGVTGLAIANKITSTMQCQTYGLDLNFLRGQSYDGAASMAGKCQGAAVRIQANYPKALYFHCAAHILNLCVVGACKVQSVQNMMGILKEISLFFSNSPKRQQELERQIMEMTNSETNKRKLVDLCRTRWIARIEAFEVFESLFSAVVNSLEVISEGARTGWNAESATMAKGLFHSIMTFEFLITLVVVKKVVGYIKGLTQLLQKKTLDICTAYSEVDNVKLSLAQVRQNIDIVHQAWYQAAVTIGDKIHAPEPSIPRRCSRQSTEGLPGSSAGDSPKDRAEQMAT